MERTEPTDPIDKTDPLEPTLKKESVDQSDQRELVVMGNIIASPVPLG